MSAPVSLQGLQAHPHKLRHACGFTLVNKGTEAAIFCKREQVPPSPFVFTSMRKGPFSTAGFARMLERAGIAAGLAFQAHPHMLRHACGFTLVNKGTDTQTYLGHKNIQHTVRYTELMATRFKNLWR